MEKPLKEVKTRYTIEHEGRYYVIENFQGRPGYK
jgi:CYTH domain-containing protein